MEIYCIITKSDQQVVAAVTLHHLYIHANRLIVTIEKKRKEKKTPVLANLFIIRTRFSHSITL